MPLTDGHGVHRQVALSALGARQRAVLTVLREHGPITDAHVLVRLAAAVPAFALLTPAAITHTLALLHELGWADHTPHGWTARTLVTTKE